MQAESKPGFVKALTGAWQQNRLLPLLTERCPRCDVEDAYAMQRLAVTETIRDGSPEGFKAGLTTLAGQQKFGADGPIYGVMWPGSRLKALEQADGVMLDHWLQPMLEVELAFRFPGGVPDVSGGVDASSLELALAIELPDLGFSPGRLTAVDIVAANVAARRFALGPPIKLSDWSALNGDWVLRHDSDTAQQGVLSAIDHEVALMHLLAHLKTQGYELSPDQWLLTGALKGMKPAQRGVYVLEASPFETLKLRLR